jgi:hypothetical protein
METAPATDGEKSESPAETLRGGDKETPRKQSNLDKVMDFVRAHKSYVLPDEQEPLRDQPKFDDVTRYGPKDDQEDRLWTLEAARLVHAVDNADIPLVFDHPWEAADTAKEGYELLGSLSDQLICMLFLCKLDNQVLLYENFRSLADLKMYVRCRRIVQRRLVDYQDSGAQKKRWSKGNLRPYCALVDFITATLARFAVKASPTEYWYVRALAGITRFSTKVKYLASSPHGLAELSLNLADDIIAKEEAHAYMGLSGPNLDASIAFAGSARGRKGYDAERAQGLTELRSLLDDEDKRVGLYFSELSLTSDFIADSLITMATCLKGNDVGGYSKAAFDICTLFHQSGISRVPTLIHQDRDGDISGTALPSLIQHFETGLNMLDQSAVAIATAKQGAAPEATTRASKFGTFSFEITDQEGNPRKDHGTMSFGLSDIGEAITLLAVQSLTQPTILHHLMTTLFINQSLSLRVSPKQVKKEPRAYHFSAFASLRTDQYDEEIREMTYDPDVRSLSRCLLAPGRLDGLGRKTILSTRNLDKLSQHEREAAAHEAAKRRAMLKKEVKSWVIEEKAVRVRCIKYVVLVVRLCAVLVIGGIMVGIFLGDRLKGVDPFNITTFAWVLAAFIMLIAKSVRVNDWPWRDFLLGRVPCRSVSELHSVTRIDPQQIIGCLLSKEPTNILITKGPYNRPFLRRQDDGFSVDVKPELWTLVSSGIIVAKVATALGMGLVCMDLRTNSKGRAVICQDDGTKNDEKILSCTYLPEIFDEDQDVPLAHEPVSWNRIVGIYHRPYKKFQ